MVRQVAGSTGGRVRRGVEQHERDDREDPLTAEVSSRATRGSAAAVAMSATASCGSSCSAMYQSTPAARPASTISGKARVPSPPARRAARIRPAGPSCGAVARDRRSRGSPSPGHARRPTPSRRRARARPRPGARQGARPTPSSRRAARTRNRGCDTRAGCRGPERPRQPAELRREPTQIGDRAAIGLGDPRNDGPVAAEASRRSATPIGSVRSARCPRATRWVATRLGQEPGELLRCRLAEGPPARPIDSRRRQRRGACRPGRPRRAPGPCRAGARSGRRIPTS